MPSNDMALGFKWKQAKRPRSAATKGVFGDDVDCVEDGIGSEEDVDWLTATKRKRAVFLEDCASKSDRLRNEGNALAEQERYWEAISRWDEALQLTPNSSILYELKSQVLLTLHEVFPAVQSATQAVQLNPTWYQAYQTLGRAQLGLGEIEMALRTFVKAVHLYPADEELWKEDLLWAVELLKRKERGEDRTPASETKSDEEEESESENSESEEEEGL